MYYFLGKFYLIERQYYKEFYSNVIVHADLPYLQLIVIFLVFNKKY